MLRSQIFAPPFFRFPRCALHTKFGHEFLGPSSPDTFLWVPAHPGARLPGHVTDFPGLRFGTVDFDEIKRIAHLFSWFFIFLCEQRPQYIVSVFTILELLPSRSCSHHLQVHASAAQTCPRLMQLRKETGRDNASGLDDEAYAITAFNIG